jgi:imidazolonepropionase-like amidohydrolase
VAESRSTLVAAHVLASEALDRCVEAGIRSLEHCLWQEAPGEYRFRPELARVMKEKGIFAGLTFASLSQARYRAHATGWQPQEDMGPWKGRLENRYAAEREMIAFGVKYVLHSDCGVRETPFGEFWLILASACFELDLTPLEAIAATTRTPAELLGWEREVGTLEAGKRADLLVVDGDPAAALEPLAKPRMVFLNGRCVAEGGVLRTAAAGDGL